jgi:hypothetical protein
MVVDYSKAKIYKIVDKTTGKVYVGSTTKELNKRLREHEVDHVLYLKELHNYVTSFEIFKNGDYEIILIENYPCLSKKELHLREGYFIKELNTVNKVVAGRSDEEYRTDNKDKIKKYRDENKDKIKEYMTIYRKENKEKLKESDRKWQIKNYDENRRKSKEYIEKNKEKIKAFKTAKETCTCGVVVTHESMRLHIKTQKHQILLNSINQ